jgi:hypothetical protein
MTVRNSYAPIASVGKIARLQGYANNIIDEGNYYRSSNDPSIRRIYKYAIENTTTLLSYVYDNKKIDFLDWLLYRIGYAISIVSSKTIAKLFLKYFPDTYIPSDNPLSLGSGRIINRNPSKQSVQPAVSTLPKQQIQPPKNRVRFGRSTIINRSTTANKDKESTLARVKRKGAIPTVGNKTGKNKNRKGEIVYFDRRK